MEAEHLDVLIVGAGLSGIGAAHHLQRSSPGKSYAILEARDDLGGTWDLFRYPGIRSDSDMHTLGYRFRPWTEAKSIADGPSILRYVRDTARDGGIDRRIRFQHRVVSAEWSSAQARWTVERRARRRRRDARPDLRLPLRLQRLLPLRRGLHPGVPGHRRLRGRADPPPALARGRRLCRQARRRDRQRRDRDDAGSGARPRGRAGDDAAALADLRHLDPGRRRARQPPARPAPRPGRLSDRALEERHPAEHQLPAQPPPAGADEEAAAPRRGQGAAGRL